MNTDHVFAPKCDVSCFNCGALVELRPMPVAALADAVRGFLLMHRRCEKPVEPRKQVELFEPQTAGVTVDTGALVRNYLDNPLNGTGPVRGQSYAIDASTDEPAPEIDPPAQCAPCYFCRSATAPRSPCPLCHKSVCQLCAEAEGESCCDADPEHDKPELTEGDLPDDYAKFAEMYPMASDPVKLTEQARRALGNTDYSAHLVYHVAKWHPSSVAFQETAHWARVECAHLDSEARGLTNPSPGLTIPAVLPMPKSLQEALRAMNGGKEPKKKRVRSAPTERARKKEQAPDAG